MWITTKPFRYRGVRYNTGDQVPAEKWPGRKALVALRRIQQVPDETPSTPSASPASMKRAELNAYATSLGLQGAEDYPNRESLLEAIDKLNGSAENAEGDDAHSSPPTPADSSDADATGTGEGSEESGEESSEDDLFAEDGD